MTTRIRPVFLSGFCVDRCTSRACDPNGDCAALAMRRRVAAADGLGAAAAWLVRHGPATPAEIATALWGADVPYPERVPDWQRTYLAMRWTDALVPHLRRHSAVFRPAGGGRWRGPPSTALARVLSAAKISLPIETNDPWTPALAAVNEAGHPLALPDLLAACGVPPVAPDYGEQARLLAARLAADPDLRCVLYDPRVGVGWRWLRADRVPTPLGTVALEAQDADLPDGADPDRGEARVRRVVRRAALLYGCLPLDAAGRALFPSAPTPAAVELHETATGRRYPGWYDPELGMLYRLDELYLMQAVDFGTEVALEPLETPGAYAITFGEVDAAARDRDRRAQSGAPAGPGRRAYDLDWREFLAADAERLTIGLAEATFADQQLDDRLADLAIRVETVAARLGSPRTEVTA